MSAKPSIPHQSKMEGCKRLLLLSVGVCMLICNVNSVAIYAIDAYNPYKDVSKVLEDLMTEKLRLETQLVNTVQPLYKRYIERDINSVKQRILALEAKSRVAYKDYLEMMESQKRHFEQERANLKNQFESEKANLKNQLERDKANLKSQLEREKDNLQRQLEKANYKHKQAVDRIGAMQQKNEQDIGIYKDRLDVLTREVERTAKEYAEYTEKQLEKEEITSAKYNKLIKEKEEIVQKLKAEKNHLRKATETLMQKLKESQNRHSWALEAMSIISKTNNSTLVPIPYQDEINEFRHNIHMLVSIGNRDELKSVTKQNLEALLQKLYEEGRLSDSTPTEDLQNLINEVEINTLQLREQQNEQRRKLQEKMEYDDQANYDKKDELASLHKADNAVEVSNEFLQDLARRKAYLKAITQVSELLEKVA